MSRGTQREPTNHTKNVLPLLGAPLRSMFSIVGWLAGGLVAAGWFAGRRQGPQDPEDMVRGWEYHPWAPTATYLRDSST